MISLIEDYLDYTTVHGFVYMHRKQYWLSRFLWVNLNWFFFGDNRTFKYKFIKNISMFSVNSHCGWFCSLWMHGL